MLLKYHVMEEREQALPPLRDWLRDTPLMQSVWAGLGYPKGDFAAWSEQLLQELVDGGVLGRRGDIVHDV